jgi:hypothetical protein
MKSGISACVVIASILVWDAVVRETWPSRSRLQVIVQSTTQLQGIHERLVFVLPRSLFCLRAALSFLLELEDFAASQPCMNVFLGHSKPAWSLLNAYLVLC